MSDSVFDVRLCDFAKFIERAAGLFIELASKAGFQRAYPSCAPLATGLKQLLRAEDADGLEQAVTRFYAELHAADAVYSDEEQAALKQMSGYWCYAGGLTPLHAILPHLGPDTILADYGSGSGLQGLILQSLQPHRLTVQIELSSRMIEKGRRLQEMFGVPAGRVEWLQANILDVPPDRFDIVYMYRPCRPEGWGDAFYRRFAEGLGRAARRTLVFSVADSLRDYIQPPVRVLKDDGHLVCFTNR
jgi:hypothetical protein